MTVATENTDKIILPPKPDFFESTLNEIKLNKTTKTKSIELCRLQGNLWLLELRKYNRYIQIRNKAVKDLTCDNKLKVDQKFLTLQNLLYQVKYLKQEIKKCYDYQSQYEDIYWIPLEQFLKIKPEFTNNAEDLVNQEVNCNDDNDVDMHIHVSEEAKIENEHRLMIARMEWELEQRKSLNLKYTEMLKKKLLIESDIRDKQKLLANIYPTLTNALKASQPLQKFFKLDFEKDYKYADLLYTIPLPLYLIYTKWQGYINLFDDNGVNLEIIEGNEINMQDITSSMVKDLEKIIKLSREQLLQKSESHEIDDIVSEDILLNYEDDHNNNNKSRTALSTNDQRYGDIKDVYSTILDCDLRNCLTPSKYSIKVTLKMDAQIFKALKCVSSDDFNEQSFATEFNIYFYPKLNVLTIKARIIDETEDTVNQCRDIGLQAWNSLKQKLLLDLDLKNQRQKYVVLDEGSTLSSSYHLPKLIKALIGVENMAQGLETSHHQTLDHCLSLIFDQIGHPFFWLENLGGLVNTAETKANCSSTLREYYSLQAIKRVVDSVTQRLASRLHIKHLISNVEAFVKDCAIAENKKHNLLLTEISQISWAEPKPQDGHYILGTLDLATYVRPQKLVGPADGPGLKVTVSLTIPLNCDFSCSHARHFEDSNRAKASPTIAFGAHEIVASGKGEGVEGSRQKLADLKVKARLYQALKDLEKKINTEQISLAEPHKNPCLLAYRLGLGLRGVSEIAKLLNEPDPSSDKLSINEGIKLKPEFHGGVEDKSLNTDMQTIFYA